MPLGWVAAMVLVRRPERLTMAASGASPFASRAILTDTQLTDNSTIQGAAQGAALFIVATPIGNLADMVPRAVEVLQAADLIAAEDTRHSKRLLQHFSITTPMIAYHDHSDDRTVARLVERLQAGEQIALISDAGTPMVSDPGYRLVDAALRAGIRTVPVPGACAAIAALSAAGLPSDRFVFEGFLPAKLQAREKHLQALSDERRTLIFYEAPHRLLDSLQSMQAVLGDTREAVLARELSKTFETIRRAPLAELVEWVAADSDQQRGECVVLIRGAAPASADDAVPAEARRTMDILMQQLPLKQAAALAAQISGVRKNSLYRYGLGVQDDDA